MDTEFNSIAFTVHTSHPEDDFFLNFV